MIDLPALTALQNHYIFAPGSDLLLSLFGIPWFFRQRAKPIRL